METQKHSYPNKPCNRSLVHGLWSYLQGMETKSSVKRLFVEEACFDPTYKGWKQFGGSLSKVPLKGALILPTRDGNQHRPLPPKSRGRRLWSYLQGMETQDNAGVWISTLRALILPTRDGNIACPFDKSFNECLLWSYLQGMETSVFTSPLSLSFSALILPTRDGNSNLITTSIRRSIALILPTRDGNTQNAVNNRNKWKLWSYLQGMETIITLITNSTSPKLWSYLQGMETDNYQPSCQAPF